VGFAFEIAAAVKERENVKSLKLVVRADKASLECGMCIFF